MTEGRLPLFWADKGQSMTVVQIVNIRIPKPISDFFYLGIFRVCLKLQISPKLPLLISNCFLLKDFFHSETSRVVMLLSSSAGKASAPTTGSRDPPRVTSRGLRSSDWWLPSLRVHHDFSKVGKFYFLAQQKCACLYTCICIVYIYI